MKYNFDELIDRRNTDAVKYDRCKALFGTDDLQPLWVADMDFRTPDFILSAIRQRLEHPVLGYTMPNKKFYSLMQQWITEHHQWNVERAWIGFLPGVVPGLSFSVQSLTEIGDEIIVQPPVYYPFFHAIERNNRIKIDNPLKEVDGIFEMDWEHLEKCFSPKTKMMILCNPHNPGGRVWTRMELEKLASVCERHNILVVSDEIHADMVLPGNISHTPFATVSDWAAQHTVTLVASTKVFNMPGLVSSGYIIPNENLRHRFQTFLEASEMNAGNMFAYIGAMAAYEHGEEWRCQMLEYVKRNSDYVADFLKTNIPQIIPMIPQASFLMWLDCKGLGMNTEELFRFFVDKAHLGLNKGTIFGTGGEMHLRLNLATPRSVLEKAMNQLYSAIVNM